MTDSTTQHDSNRPPTVHGLGSSILSEEDVDPEFIYRTKARFRGRLQDRWTCKTPGHIYCFANHEGAHAPVNENAMETWVAALHDGDATLLIPPKNLFSSNHYALSDAASVSSTTSRSMIQYQRHFRLQGNPSLTDLRSMQCRLRESMASSSCVSSASSGVPGIGYLSGKGVKWIGLKMLDVIAAVAIRRRRHLIPKLVKRIRNLPADQRTEWMVKNQPQMNRTIQDVLELSLDSYKTEYRTSAIELGSEIRDLIIESNTGSAPVREWFPIVNAMRVKSFPLQLLADEGPATQDFVADLRETLLQDPLELVEEEEHLVAEIAVRICYELTNGIPSLWRYQGYKTLWALYKTPIGRHCLQYLVRTGGLVKKLAINAFNTAIPSATEHAQAIDFFVMLAHDMPEFRDYLLVPTGVPLLIQNIKGLATANPPIPMLDLCAGLGNISHYPWCLSSVPLDTCQVVNNLLIISQSNGQLGDPSGKAWGCEMIILFLYNLSVYSSEGRQAIHDATTNELLVVLATIESNLKKQRGDRAARRTRARIKTTWPGYRSPVEPQKPRMVRHHMRLERARSPMYFTFENLDPMYGS
ncbi:hypothetical protein PILCRDRAFT_10061 [Piloderma croceum F 1598]|uniref:Uncharacterized protein n=1 Tax=Piloderma croceum (strain F 1598) TaxID=765440 RepID=A0A0C3FK54_PILCF|nr:hypothetical protein PILCRDRAFT_10061 [Piloderma croceum F 1598]